MNKFCAICLAGAAMVSMAIYKANDLTALYWESNKIYTSDGVVRLGKVNSERVMIEFSIRNMNSNEKMIAVDSYVDDVKSKAIAELETLLASVNKDGGIKGADGKKELLKIENATYKDDVEITKRAYVVYVSEYMPRFELTIDQSEYIVKAGEKPIYKMIADLDGYTTVVSGKAVNAPSFINRVDR